MRQQTRPLKDPAGKVVQDIRRATRKHYSAEEKIRIVLEGSSWRGQHCRAVSPRGIAQDLSRWSKDFLEAGKKRGQRSASRGHGAQGDGSDLTLENRVLKKSVTGDGEDGE